MYINILYIHMYEYIYIYMYIYICIYIYVCHMLPYILPNGMSETMSEVWARGSMVDDHGGLMFFFFFFRSPSRNVAHLFWGSQLTAYVWLFSFNHIFLIYQNNFWWFNCITI